VIFTGRQAATGQRVERSLLLVASSAKASVRIASTTFPDLKS